MQDNLFEYIEQYVSLTEEEKGAIMELDIFRQIKKGTVLLSRGECKKQVFFVLKGCLRTFYMIDGEEKTTAFYTEMDGITPHCVMDNKPSKYYIAAVEDSLITVSTPDMENAMFEKFPKFETLCRIISEKELLKNQLSYDEFKTSSPEERYLQMLDKRPDLLQRVPQHQLASFLGITPQSLSRIRARLFEKKK